MKRKLGLLSLAALSILLLLQSCQKEVDFDTDSQVTGDFRAKIDGTPWVATKIAIGSRMAGIINLTGQSNDGKIITITLTDSSVHRYILSDVTMNAGAYFDSASNPYAMATNQGEYPSECGGEVNITSIDTAKKKMSGTFSFKVYRQFDSTMMNITEGVFNNISYEITLPPTSATDTFKVKIGGTQWIPPTVIGAITPAVPPMPAQIALTGTDATGSKSVGLLMPGDITPGTYTLSLFGATYIGLYNPNSDPNMSQASTSGTLTILSHNPTTKRIRGNFSFHAQALLNPLLTTELTEGYFSLTYH